MENEGVSSAVVMGVSMGGMVAQCLAIATPDRVQGLVLCATAGAFPASARTAIRSRGDTSRNGEMSEVIDATLARWFVADSPPGIVERCRARLSSDDWHSWSANWEAISELNNLEGLRGLAIPTLVIAGDQDASIPVAVARQLADASRADFTLMENSAHFGAFDAPHRFTPVIDRFLAKVCQPGL
jgi:3-oxoadipate enol-lactonase